MHALRLQPMRRGLHGSLTFPPHRGGPAQIPAPPTRHLALRIQVRDSLPGQDDRATSAHVERHATQSADLQRWWAIVRCQRALRISSLDGASELCPGLRLGQTAGWLTAGRYVWHPAVLESWLSRTVCEERLGRRGSPDRTVQGRTWGW